MLKILEILSVFAGFIYYLGLIEFSMCLEEVIELIVEENGCFHVIWDMQRNCTCCTKCAFVVISLDDLLNM